MSVFADKLLERVKLTLRQAGKNDFDEEIASYIDTAAEDLQNAGILSIYFDASRLDWDVDSQILQAVRWYCLSVFGLYNADMEKYDKAYKSLKATLATQNKYSRDYTQEAEDDLVQKVIERLKEYIGEISGGLTEEQVREIVAKETDDLVAKSERDEFVKGGLTESEETWTDEDKSKACETIGAVKQYIPTANNTNFVYTSRKDGSGNVIQGTYRLSASVMADTIPITGTGGSLPCGVPPNGLQSYHATPKAYVDGLIAELRAEIEALKNG
jgi:hypothetical protein